MRYASTPLPPQVHDHHERIQTRRHVGGSNSTIFGGEQHLEDSIPRRRLRIPRIEHSFFETLRSKRDAEVHGRG